MSSFEEKVRALDLGMAFQEEYAKKIDTFRLGVLRRLSSAEELTSAQAEILLTTDPLIIDHALTAWIKVVIDSRVRLCHLLANYLISDAYMCQRTWADGQWRIYGEVVDMYALPSSSILEAPAQVSKHAIEAIKIAFPVDISGAGPLNGADREFEAQLRERGNPWIGRAESAL